MSVIPDPATTDWVPMGFGLGGPLPSQPATKVWNNAAQSMGSGATLAITYNTAKFDYGGAWSASTPTRLTCQVAGRYEIGCAIMWASNASGYRELYMEVNGTRVTDTMELVASGGGEMRQVVSTVVDLKVGDYIVSWIYQTSGGALNINSYGDSSPVMWMALMGGVPGPPGIGVPTPVVNGQWIKGSGGAAIWNSIGYADLPSTLQYIPTAISDCNLATNPGWYRLNSGSTNAPDSGYWQMLVLVYDSGQIRQFAYAVIAQDKKAERRMDSGTWQPWKITQDTGWTNLSLTNSAHYGGPYGPAQICKVGGAVYFRGLITINAVSNNLQIYNAPAGYRTGSPYDLIFFTAVSPAAAALGNMETFRIDYTGNLRAQGGLPSGAWMSLNGITYPADG